MISVTGIFALALLLLFFDGCLLNSDAALRVAAAPSSGIQPDGVVALGGAGAGRPELPVAAPAPPFTRWGGAS
jgi:hypothetical protein